MQGQLVFGELLLSTKQGGGKTEQQWRTWILLFEPVLGDGNFCTLETSRYTLLLLLLLFCTSAPIWIAKPIIYIMHACNCNVIFIITTLLVMVVVYLICQYQLYV